MKFDKKKHILPGYYYDEPFADQVVGWFPKFIRHTVGPLAGKPFHLSPWQEFDIIRPLFGVKSEEDGTRRYRTVWIEIPKKNGKTTLIAAVNILATVGLNEPGAQVYCLACDRKQARICFEEAVRMVRASPTLEKAFHIYRDRLEVPAFTDKRTGEFISESIYRPLSSEIGSNDGYNASAVTIDEVHRQKNWELYRVMQYSTSGRNEPFFFMATTAGLWEPDSLYWNLRDRAMKIESGVIDNPSWLVCRYAAPDDADWKDEKVWYACNPELGKAKSIKGMREDFANALADPNETNNFKRLHLNIVTNQATLWLDSESWNGCPNDTKEDELIGQPCYAGLDISAKIDMSALVLCWDLGERYVFRSWFWLPEENIKKLQDQTGAPYDAWHRDGWLDLTDGTIIDHRAIENKLVELSRRYDIREVAFDPYNATQFSVQAQERGINMVEFRQVVTEFSEPMKTFHGLVLAKQIEHGDHPILNWHASNVIEKRNPNGDIRPDKSVSANKIDGIVAALMAFGRAIKKPAERQPIYTGKGSLFL